MIDLPFPPASLSGHHDKHWRSLQPIKKKHRQWAHVATLAAAITVPETGDIRVKVLFVPPDRRGDRTNYPNRMKPYFDGIADALGVNDRRFLPEYVFAEPAKPGRVEVEIIPCGDVQNCTASATFAGGCAMENASRENACNALPGSDRDDEVTSNGF